MRTFTLKKEGALRLNRGELDLISKNIEESTKSCFPGELVTLEDKIKKKKYYAFINPLAQSGNEINLINNLWGLNLSLLDLEKYIVEVLERAHHLRESLMQYKGNSRLFYGNADGLPGLIVDGYINYIIIQINSAGVDNYRTLIKTFYQNIFQEKKVIFLDNEKYRERQGLPVYEKEEMEEKLEIQENGFKYNIRNSVIQKVGYYYDHRENRKKIQKWIHSFDKEFKTGLDLFSYIGSWGIHFLAAGADKVDFVDQGNFDEEIKTTLLLNGQENKGIFYRENVFKFLDNAFNEGKTYDIICSDPPAFAKSFKEKNAAIEGYNKLHRKILKICANESLFIAASCTHYIDHAEFQKTVKHASELEGVTLTLLDMGTQGADHPNMATDTYNNYIKFYLYLVRKK